MTSSNAHMRAYDEAADRRAFWAMVCRFCLVGLLAVLFFVFPLLWTVQ